LELAGPSAIELAALTKFVVIRGYVLLSFNQPQSALRRR